MRGGTEDPPADRPATAPEISVGLAGQGGDDPAVPPTAPASRPRRRRRRIVVSLVAVVVLVALLLGLAALSAWHSVSAARTDLAQARADLSSLAQVRSHLISSAGRQQAAQEIADMQSLAQQASQDLTSSPGLSVLGALPYFHQQRSGVVDLAADVSTTASSGQRLLDDLNQLIADTHGTVVSMPDLRTLDADLGTAIAAQQATIRPASGLSGSLAADRLKLDGIEGQVVQLLRQGKQLVDYAIPFLGGDGPRLYLVVAQNNAEMRDQGSILSYALMETDDGEYGVGPAQSTGQLRLDAPAPIPVPAGTEAVFGGYLPTQLWQSTNATADFAWSGAAMQSMFQQATGIHVDGVVALDVPFLSHLLTLTGPVKVKGIVFPVTAKDVVPLLLHDLYDGLGPGSDTEHDDQTAGVFGAVVRRLQGEHVDLAHLANVVAQSVSARDLLAWDEVPGYEATITHFGASGAIDTVEPDRTFHVAVENGTATKLDYYIDVKEAMAITVTTGNHAVVDTTVTVVNTAPPHQPPSFQLGPNGATNTVPGQYIAHVYLWSPRGSEVLGGVDESGLVLLEQDTSVLPHQEESVTFQTVIPDAVRHGGLRLVLVPQPRLRAEQVTATLSAPGWNVESPPTVRFQLTRLRYLNWVVRPG